MKRDAGSCAGTSVHIERMMHMSSTHSPRLEKTSLTSMPDLPYFLNSNGVGNATPLSPGSDLFAYFASAGLGSNVSTCDGAPPAKMWMTCCALAGSGGSFGASGEVADAADCRTTSAAIADEPDSVPRSNIPRDNAPI